VRHSVSVKPAAAPDAPCATHPPMPAGPAVEPPSVEGLYDEHFDYVWCALRRLGVSAASIDDAVQDVFLVVHRRLPQFEGRSSTRTWLFGIAIRVAREHHRRERRARTDAELPLPATPSKSPFEETAAAEGARMLDALLGELEESRREIFVLTELEHLTAPEIATLLELNVNTVYSRLRTARAEFERAVARLQGPEGRTKP
jgi:RNA polymerase sigma-70 factor, ECF subfamily